VQPEVAIPKLKPQVSVHAPRHPAAHVMKAFSTAVKQSTRFCAHAASACGSPPALAKQV
jgi:hypothetical protein